MKQFYAFAFASLFAMQVSAQYAQNFDAATSLTTGCSVSTNSYRTTTVGEIINGTGSLYSNPPVNGSGTRDFSSPYLNVVNSVNPSATMTDLTVAFNYMLNQSLNGQAVRTIEIGLQGVSSYTSLATITMNAAYSPVSTTAFNNTYTVPTGVYRLVLKMGGSQGNGSTRIIIDDLVTNVNSRYSGGCNTLPLIKNDVYFVNNYNATLFPSVLDNDDDMNSEGFKAPAVTATSPDGTVVFNNDGSFTFTPNAGFTGTATTFTYTVFDNGYDPASGTATVTINFLSTIALPVRLTSFAGSMQDGKAILNWNVAENESGSQFELEQSSNGTSFNEIAVIMNTGKSGTESYNFSEAMLQDLVYYRLRIVNRNGAVNYSNIVRLERKTATAPAKLQLMQNPVQQSLSFSYTAADNENASLKVYNTAGSLIMSRPVRLVKGTSTVSVEGAGNLLRGSYIVEISSSKGRAASQFFKQ